MSELISRQEGWNFSIYDVDGYLIHEGFNYETERDAEDAATEYANDNNIVYYSFDVYQTELFWR